MKLKDAIAVVIALLASALILVSVEAKRQRRRADMCHDGYLEVIAEVKKLQKENQDLRDLFE